MAVDHLQLNLPSPLQPLFFEPWSKYNQKIFIKRDDLIHPDIPGNKWRKLSGHLDAFRSGNYHQLLTFGGAYSNHITATAAACHYLGIPAIGLIRGELDLSNPALRRATDFGMKLYPVARHQYREKDTESFRQELLHRFGAGTYIVPEGGAGIEGVLGCRRIVQEIEQPFDYILTASGTGTTLAGLSSALPERAKAIGISVLKGEDTLSEYVRSISGRANFELMTDYHFGGYARTTPELLAWMRNFQSSAGIPLDYVYTGKLMAAMDQLLSIDYFDPNSTIILLHTGGVANAPVA